MIGAIIQARMGSHRLPMKTMKVLEGKPVLQHVIERIRRSKFIKECVVAATTDEKDHVIQEFCQLHQIKCFRGNENDVLERFFKAAKKYQFDIIVRITADDPLKDPKIIDEAITILVENNLDYVTNTMEPTYPEGIDVEVFTFEALRKAYLGAKLPSEREHVTPYLWKNPERFKLHNFKYSEDLSSLRWTMDTEDDYQFMQAVYRHFQGCEMFYMEDVLSMLKIHPEIAHINT